MMEKIQRTGNPKLNKKTAVMVLAAMTAAAVAVTGIYRFGGYVQDAEVYAKDSFAGMKQIVEEHDSDNPFTILDISPTRALYTLAGSGKTYNLSTGTIGYLTGGQAPIEKDLQRIIKDDTAFYEYDKRKELADAILPSDYKNEDFLTIEYEEAYGGTIDRIDERGDWIKLYDSVETDGTGDDSVPTGRMMAYVEEVDTAAGEDGAYQYDGPMTIGMDDERPEGGLYALDESGKWHVTFEYDPGASAGYVPVMLACDDLSSYSSTTGVYYMNEDGVYEYVGTKAQILGLPEENKKPADKDKDETDKEQEKEQEKDPGEDPGKDPGEDPGKDPEDDPGKDPEDDPEKDPEDESEDDPGEDPGEDPKDDPEKDPEDESEDDPGEDPGDDPENDPENAPENDLAAVNGRWYKLVALDEEDGGTVPEEADGEEEKELSQSAGKDYYILEFHYVSDPSDETKLYKVKDKEEVSDEDGAVMPYDRYTIDESIAGEGDAEEEADAEADEEDDEIMLMDYALGGSDAPVFKYVGTGGNYNLRMASEGDDDYDAAREVEVENVPVYFRCCKSNDWLEEYVFNALEDQDNYYEQFAIEVVSVTAQEVTPEMVEEADLIYLESGMSVFINNDTPIESIGPDNGGMEDISDASILEILYRAVADMTPVIVDYDIISSPGRYEDSNYRKLARIFLKEDLAGYYYDMGKDDLLDDLFRGLDSDDYDDNTDNDCNYVNRNVYMVNGETPLVSSDFPASFDDEEAERGFKEVLIAIRAENTTLREEDWLEEEVSKARAIAYIINYSVGMIGDYSDVSILELQPSAYADADLDPGLDLHVDVDTDRKTTTLYWQKKDSGENGQQIFRSTRMVEVTDSVKSVAEFNGEWEDINSVYDMVFIGLDGQRLNREGRDDHTVYNDGELEGLVYHTGDLAAGKDSRYDANDITEQKKEALLDYLRAGYPVVVENNCINTKKSSGKEYRSVNKRYIADNTQMYAFLEEALEEYGDYLYTVRDVRGNPEFRAQLNVIKPRIDHQEETEAVQELVPAEDGRYEGTILYKLTSSQETEEDNVYHGNTTLRLYLDVNYDGVFAPSEELQPTEETGGYVNADGQISIRIDGVESGILPWKLEVSDTDNGYRRDAMTGYFTIRGKTQMPVSVLQVLDDKGSESADLEKNFKEIRNSTLGHYLEAAEDSLNVKYEIRTVTTDELIQSLAVNGKYLDQWDVLVLGFGKTGSLGEAQSAVETYIEEGRSVLISYAGAQEETGRLGLNGVILGQTDDMTYSKLGRDGSEYYRYKDLDRSMFADAMPGLQVQKINEGSISHYPFEVGGEYGTVFFSDVTRLMAPEYLLDLTGNTRDSELYVTGWYTLNDNESTDGGGYYVSPRDARNNYYIYSRANVVYVGQNEYPYFYDRESGEEPVDGVDECKLFVNALMAAYNAGIHNPQVDIVAGFGAASSTVESIPIPFDQEFKIKDDEDGGILDETVDVYFKFMDNNVAFDKVTEISFYYENGNNPDALLVLPDGSINTDDFIPFTSPIWMVENNRLVEATGDLTQGTVYRIKAPVVALKGNDEEASRIFIALETSYTKGGRERHAVGTDSISLNRAQMFLLE